MVRMGDDTCVRQVQAVAGQYTISQAEAGLVIARAVRDKCPSLISDIPAGAPLP
jgi:hypothetical protein